MKHEMTTAFAALIALAIAQPAWAQDWQQEANYGAVELNGDFSPDPHTLQMVAGGPVNASLSVDCGIGFVSEPPDLTVDYSDAGRSLAFFVESYYDTTLLVNSPSGDWHCNDDFNDSIGGNPGLVFQRPRAGLYDVWVGVHSRDFRDAELYITGRENLSQLIERIEAARGPGIVASGSGFVVSNEGHILTNHHVLAECNSQTFQVRGGAAVEASLVATNIPTDLALLQADIDIEPVRFRSGRGVRLGDEVVVYGFPLTGDLSSQGNLTNGIISALSGLDDDLSRLQMNAEIQPGNSGGPVMDRNGQVVGVVVESASEEFFRQMRGTEVQNVNFAIRNAMALAFLDTNNVDYNMGWPISSEASEMSVADIAQQAQDFTGIIQCYR